MNATTLRIGNYHYYHMVDKLDDRKEWDEICTIDAEDLVWLSSEKGKKDTDYKPIPLTEEWLLEFGFEKHSSNPFWFRKKQLCISVLGAIELISWDMNVFKIDTKAEHVHTLQNLYFALTGEEL